MSALYLIQGCPGGGKTTELSRQAARGVQAHGPSSVAILSLTRAAAHEIGGRDTGVPDEHCSTLHAAVYRALDTPDLADTPDGIKAWNEAHPADALTRGVRQLDDPAEIGEGAGRADELHAAVTNHRARMTPPERWTDDERDWHARWTDFKAQTDRLDFTDLIERGLRDLPSHPASPRALLIDEAQDFSRLEFALAVRWAQAADTTVLVGDLQQAIYHFRGADPEAFDRLDLAGERVLTTSHRCPAAVRDRARRWIGLAPGARDHDWTGTAEQGRVTDDPASLRDPAAVCDHLAHRLAVEEGSVGLLATCGYMLTDTLRELRERGIAHHNPHRPDHAAWNPLRGATAKALGAFLRPRDDVWGPDAQGRPRARAWTWGDLHAWTDPLRADALTRGSKRVIEQKCERDRFGESRAAEEPELETVMEIVGARDLHHPALRLDVDWWANSLRAAKAKSARPVLELIRRGGVGALTAAPRLVVGTIHSVKGATLDHVSLLPDLSRDAYWGGWQGGVQERAAIVRVFYVGLTRARRTLTVLDPAGPESVPMEDLAPAMGVAA